MSIEQAKEIARVLNLTIKQAENLNSPKQLPDSSDSKKA